MPEITAILVALLAGAVLFGIALGWMFRGGRAEQEKKAINAGWQEQREAKEVEHARLAEQNKGLMEQVSQFQASHKDSKMRAQELSAALKEAVDRRDELQREIKEIRNNLEATVAEKAKIQSDIDTRAADEAGASQKLAAKDERIAKLGRELEKWHERLPPLVQRFRERNEEAQGLEVELAEARERIEQLEALSAVLQESQVDGIDPTQTRVEPVRDPDTLTDGRDASNEPMGREMHDGADDAAINSLRDNLKLIKGVGPAIEKTLNEMGIFRFSQIAEMSEYDIDRVARRLKGYRTRIYREDWMGQARTLHDEKVNVMSDS